MQWHTKRTLLNGIAIREWNSYGQVLSHSYYHIPPTLIIIMLYPTPPSDVNSLTVYLISKTQDPHYGYARYCGVVASAPDFERADEGSILTAGLCFKSGKSECNNSGYKLTGLTWWP